MSLPEVLRRITTALEQAEIMYMLTGSFASAYYGAPRSTQDIDLVIAGSITQLKIFVESLPQTQYYSDANAAVEAHQHESMFNVIDLESGWKIDLIIRKSRTFSREEFERRHLVEIQDIRLFIASAEDVIIAKLEWAKRAQSQRQIEDAAGIMRIQRDSLDRSHMEKWVQELELSQEWQVVLQIAGNLP